MMRKLIAQRKTLFTRIRRLLGSLELVFAPLTETAPRPVTYTSADDATR